MGSKPAEERPRRLLLLFFFLTFLFSWSIQVPEALASLGLLPNHVPGSLLILSGFGPAIAALITAWAAKRGEGVRTLIGRLIRFRVHWLWYLVALAGPALILLAGRLAEQALGGSPSPISNPPMRDALGMASMPLGLFLLALLLNNLLVITGEELGWRGFALPQLQRFQPDLAAGITLGVLWGLWHLPLVWAPAAGSAVSELPLWAFFVDIIGSSILYVWLFNHTRGSAGMATIAHAANNTAAVFLMPAGTASLRQFMLTIAVRTALVIVVVLVCRGMNFGPRPSEQG